MQYGNGDLLRETMPAVDGTVQTIHVKTGESVATGQLLFELA